MRTCIPIFDLEDNYEDETQKWIDEARIRRMPQYLGQRIHPSTTHRWRLRRARSLPRLRDLSDWRVAAKKPRVLDGQRGISTTWSPDFDG